MSNKEAMRQFMNVIKSDLNRWFEVDLDVEDLAGATESTRSMSGLMKRL